MSIAHSVSTDSTSSSTHANEQPIDPSNILYNDHQNYQIIFSNDSRFFDTSLHLFKSYSDLGYIPIENKKFKKRLFSTTTTTTPSTFKSSSTGHHNRWKSKATGFNNGHTKDDDTLKPSFTRNNDYSMSQRSDPGSSKLHVPKVKRDNVQIVLTNQRQRSSSSNHAVINDDLSSSSSDDPDIIVTRL